MILKIVIIVIAIIIIAFQATLGINPELAVLLQNFSEIVVFIINVKSVQIKI
jgi:hypothetical protein